jgi:D-amino-acid oxidase
VKPSRQWQGPQAGSKARLPGNRVVETECLYIWDLRPTGKKFNFNSIYSTAQSQFSSLHLKLQLNSHPYNNSSVTLLGLTFNPIITIPYRSNHHHQLTMEAPQPKSHQTIAILGAGITGLQTALSILSSGAPASQPGGTQPPTPPKVIIIAQHLPGDESIEYTSPWAGGHWRSHAHSSPEEAEIRDWDARTYQFWRELLQPKTLDGAEKEGKTREALQEDLEKELGLGVRESIMLWSEETDETRAEKGDGEGKGEGNGLWWRDVVTGFRVLSPQELSQASRASHASRGEGKGDGKGEDEIVFGARYDTVCINVPRYLTHLTEKITALGGEFIRAQVRTDRGVEGIVEDVQRLIHTHPTPASHGPQSAIPPPGLSALVLATGLSSRKFLPADEAGKLYPVKGQTVLVRGEAPRAVTRLFPGGGLGYVIPRPGSGTTVLGGSRGEGDWSEEADARVTEAIWRWARALVPELWVGGTGAKGGGGEGELEVLGVQVGRRPGRKGGPRVEVEKEKVRGVRVVYSYGHEGAGYQNSVGSAEKVVGLLNGI